MQINRDDLARHYAAMGDEELASIDPDELTEAARQCYEAEVQRRGPTEFTEGELEEEVAIDIAEDWEETAAVAAAFMAVPGSNAAEHAGHARDALMDAGVPCNLAVVDAGSEGDGLPRYDEYRVLVPESLNLKAMSVLDLEIFNPEIEADWRAHLAGLSDEALRALSPATICAGLRDRAERLTRAFQEELASRS